MSDYRIFETEEFQKQRKKVTAAHRAVIERNLSGYGDPPLRTAPYYGPNVRRLQGYVPPTWRYRIGNYRVFYSVDEEERVVFMLTIDDRKDAYK